MARELRVTAANARNFRDGREEMERSNRGGHLKPNSGLRLQLFSFVMAIVVVGGAVFGAIKLLELPRGRSDASTETKSPTAATGPAKLEPAPQETNSAAAAINRPTASDIEPIYRCLEAGRTIYTDTPCPDAPSAPIDILPPRGFEPTRTQVEVTATSDESVALTSSAPLDSVRVKQQCVLLDREIAAIDARARQALSIPEQDQLRRKREAIRSKQFALKCHQPRE